MEKKICIIHFNTPVLTHCLVRSINKYTPGATIYIFDNSTKSPFINTFDNVTVFDNTKGEIVDFDAVLKKYPLHVKSRGKTNNYGSAKHSMSIQKCVELIGDNFVLLDSDVLLKRDISPIFNDRYVWIAGVEDWTNKTLVGAKKRKRVCPFLMYMNVNKMNELGIEFYNDTHMLGFNNGPKCEEYETGVWFYEATPKQYRRVINYNDYIRHFRAGSWLEDARTKQRYKQIDPIKWLEKNKQYWLNPDEKLEPRWDKKLLQSQIIQQKTDENKPNFSNFFDHIYCLHYLPAEERFQKIKDELKRVGIDESADYFSWVYDYPTSLIDLVFNDKRVNMTVPLRASGREYIKRVSMKHYEIIKEAYSLGYDRILILENDIRFHNDLGYIERLISNMPDTDIIMFDKMVCSAVGEGSKYQRYIKTLPEDSLYGSMNESGVFFIFCSCYSLNRKAMEHILKTYEKNLLPPDTPLNDKTLSGSFAVVNLAIQDPKLKTRTSESYDKIGLNTAMYECKENANTKSTKPEQVTCNTVTGGGIFRMPTRPILKRRIEPNSPHKVLLRKRHSQEVEPTSVKRETYLRNRKQVRTRAIHAKATGFNKLYDV